MTIVVNTIDPVRVPTLYPREVTLSGAGFRYPGDSNNKQVDVFVDGTTVSKLPLYYGQNFDLDLRIETQPHAAGFVDLTLSKFRGFTEISAFGPECMALAASSDLQHVVKFDTNYSGSAYISHDGGATWSTHDLPDGSVWESSVISDTGQTIGVVRHFIGVDRHLLFSFNGGASWAELGPRKKWRGLAMSRNGTKIYSAEGLDTHSSPIHDSNGTLVWTGEGYVYRSLDGGATFSACTVLDKFEQVDCSYDGSVVLATTYQGLMYLSTDSGDNWQTLTQPEESGWPIVSGDGSTIFFRQFTGSTYDVNKLYRSTDHGVTWQLLKEQTYLGSFSVDYTGQTIIWDQGLGSPYLLSRDGGATWQYLTGIQNGTWGGVISSTGLKFAILGSRTDAANKYFAFEISEANPLLETLTIPDAIEYVDPMAITDVNPASGPLAGGNTVTISGSGFYALQQEEGIWFGSVYAGHGTFVDANTYTVEVPPSASAGPVLVSIQTANDYAEYGYYTYEEALPPPTRSTWSYTVAAYRKGLPAASDLTMLHVLAQTVKFAAGLPGSQARARVAATADTVFSIQHDESEVGTCTFLADQSVGVYEAVSDFTVTPGQFLSVVAPADQDATLEDVAFTIVGVAQKVRAPIVSLLIT